MVFVVLLAPATLRAAPPEDLATRTFEVPEGRRAEVVTALRSAALYRAESTPDGVLAAGDGPSLERAALIVDALVHGVDVARLLWLGTETGRQLQLSDPRLGSEPPQRLWHPEATPFDDLVRSVESAFEIEIQTVDLGSGGERVGRLYLESARLFETLDALTVPAGLVWVPVGGRRIVVTRDDPGRWREWTPLGLLVQPLHRADPRRLARLWSSLGVRRVAFGSDPAVALAMSDPRELALAHFVAQAVEAEAGESESGDGELRGEAPVALWLGTRERPLQSRLQLALTDSLVRPDSAAATEGGPFQAFAGPPRLAAGPVVSAGVVATADDGAATERSRRRRSTQHRSTQHRSTRRFDTVLAERLRLHVALAHCRWPGYPRMAAGDDLPGGDRLDALEAFTFESSLTRHVLGSNLVVLAPDVPYCQAAAAHQGIADIPLDGLDSAPLLAKAAELDLRHTAAYPGPPKVLFAVGDWEALQALVEAARAIAD